MSWFFGKKKHHRDSPPESPEEESAPADEGFIFIEKRNQPGPNDTPSLYPSLTNITPYPAMPQIPPAQVPKQNSQEGPCNDLSCIPFKLCRDLERNMNEDLVIDKLRLKEIESFINRINVESYEYDFSGERSVIAEIDSQNEQ